MPSCSSSDAFLSSKISFTAIWRSRRSEPMSHSSIVTGAVALACLLSAAQLGAQAPAAEQEYDVPRTPYGHPDLQGFWTNASFTPVERPEALGDKAFYTDDELDQIIEQGVSRGFEQTEPGTVADVHY